MTLVSSHAAEDALRARGVILHSPASTVLQGIDPENFEPGAEIYPSVTLRGASLQVGAGSKLGKAGGGYFEDVQVGRGCDLYGGYFKGCTLLDGVTIRGHAEVRGGTLLEERCEAAHHVGYKMTVQLPFVVAGSLINFCDALMAGGTSRKDHSEIGSTLALYNYTPWGDKWASLFGDVARGVFLRSPRVFVGGQTKIVSPVHVGFGAVIPAGCSVRRDVGEGRLAGDAGASYDQAFDASMLGAIEPKLRTTVRYIANLYALLYWYREVRLPSAQGDAFLTRLYGAAMGQLEAGVAERLKRLDQVVARLPESLAAHERASSAAAAAGENAARARHDRRASEHRRVLADWPRLRAGLSSAPPPMEDEALKEIARAFHTQRAASPETTYLSFMTDHLDPSLVARGVAHMQAYTEQLCAE